MAKAGLTKRQKEHLDWIRDYIIKNDGMSPSYDEVGKAMGTSISAAQRVVSEIIKRGYLTNIKGSQRTLALVGD